MDITKNLDVSKKRNDKIRKALDVITLLSVLQYAAYRFMQSTMFAFVYSQTYKWGTFGLLLVSGTFRFLYILLHEWKDQAKHRDRKRYLNKGIIIVCVFIPFFYTGWKHDYKVLVFMPFIALCLYNMKTRIVLYSFTAMISVLLAATIICSLSGSVRNLVGGWGDHLWGSYGIINTSDFAAYFSYLLLFFWCSQKEHNWRSSISFFAVCLILLIFIFWLTNSRTFVLCGALTLLAILWDAFSENSTKERKIIRRIQRSIDRLTVIMLPLMCLVFLMCVVFYSRGFTWSFRLNELFSDRLRTTLEIYRKYGIGFFGSTMSQMHGNGSTLVYNWSSGYGYLDSSFAMLAIKYGVIILVIVLGIWVWMTKRAVSIGNRRIALSMAIIAMHAFSEARFLDLNYNILLVMPLCAFNQFSDQSKAIPQKELKKQERIFWYKWILAILSCIAMLLFFPKAMSWLRTIVALHGWTAGIHSFTSFALSLGFVVLLLGFWKTVCLILNTRNKKAIVIPGIILIALSCCVYAGNSYINHKCQEQNERLLMEESIIGIIKENATQPVYVAEESEIYQRFYGGFTEHAFSTEELFRPPQGTIITDVNTESLGVLRAWGWTVQISPWSRIYTYDPAVLNALTEAGFTKSIFFDSERSCDLVDLAYRNGLHLNTNQELILEGPTKSINNALEWDQFEGLYEARFVFEEIKTNEHLESDHLCTLYVMGEAGGKVIQKRDIYRNDGGESYSVTISYEIPATPKVSYLLVANENTRIALKDISWKRVR